MYLCNFAFGLLLFFIVLVSGFNIFEFIESKIDNGLEINTKLIKSKIEK